MKIQAFIIALLVVGLFATIFTMSSVDLSQKYSTSYDNETLEVFEDTEDLHNLATALEEKNNEQNTESGVLDLVGAYIGRALDTIKLSFSSFTVFEKMTSTASDKIGLPSVFKVTAISIVLVLLVFAFIAVMVKWDP